MNNLTRRSFLQALGLSVPGLAAAKLLPEAKTDAPTAVTAKPAIATASSPISPSARGEGQARTISAWIDGEEFDCVNIGIHTDGEASHEVRYTGGPFDDLSYYADRRQSGLIVVQGIQQQLADDQIFGRHIEIRVQLSEGTVTFKAYLTSANWHYSDKVSNYVTAVGFTSIKDVVFQQAAT